MRRGGETQSAPPPHIDRSCGAKVESLLEMCSCWSHSENRTPLFSEMLLFAGRISGRKTGTPLFLEMLILLVAFPDGKPDSTFPGNAL
jgi:hypothetical protein